MTNLNQAFNIFTFGKKFFSTEGLLLAIISAPGSLTMTNIFEVLIKDVPLKDLILPLLVAFTAMLFYNIVFGLDFWSGLKASKGESKSGRFFESGKAYSSIFKYFVVISILFMLSVFSMLSALAHLPYIPKFFLISTGIIGLMAGAFEIKSIGENIERMNNKRYPFFDFIDNIIGIMKDGVGERLRSFFKIPPKK
jgi:glucan phosphoethanolaminetransferase (alkaline phosphatase superfamily)